MPMYSVIEYSSNYSKTTKILWFYSTDEATTFDAGIANIDEFKIFKYKVKLLGNTVAYPTPNAVNGILTNAVIAVPLKCLRNFWRSLEKPLINCEVQLKLKWTNHCVLSGAGADNGNGNANDNFIIFTIRDTKLYVLALTLSAREIKNYQNFLARI